MTYTRYKLEEIAIFNKQTIKKSDGISHIEYLDTSSITENFISDTTYMSVEEAPSRAQRRVEDKTIIYSTVRPRLKHYGILTNPQGNLIVSTGFATIDIKEEYKGIVDARYLYLLITQPAITEYIGSIADTAVSAYPSINPSDLQSLSFDFPDISVQQQIANIWENYDKKIALNRAINDNLEAMAKQLYDYWFVQFDFPNEEGKPYKSSGGKMVWNEKLKREIPAGWNVKSIFNELSVQYGYPFSTDQFTEEQTNVPVVRIRDILDNSISAYSHEGTDDKYRLNEGDLLVGMDGNFHMNYWIDNTAYLNQRSVRLRATERSTVSVVQARYDIAPYIKAKELRAKGSTVGHLSDKDLKELYVIVGTSNKLREAFDSLLNRIIANRKENLLLIKQRDELLPLLMNGQVSVNYHLSKSYMRQFVYSYYHSLKNTMKQKFIHSVLQELSKVLDSQQLDFVENTLEQKLLDLDIIEQVTNEELVNQENEELLTAFLSAKKIEGCSAKTIKYYKSTINHLFDEIGKTTAEITTNDIRSYLAYYQEQKQSSKVTIDNMRRIFSSFFSWLEDEDYIVKSPVRRIHKVRTDTLVKEVINDECMELLRDNCTEIRDLAMIDLLASTGMRVGELVQMNIDDVDFQERQCKVFGKGNKEREVYFNARAKIHLQQYISQREDDNPALFVSFSSPHKRLSISGVEVRLRTLGRRINLPKIHPHKFRRTLATMAIDKGMPIEQVQRLLGHVKIDTTLHYAMVNQHNVKISHRRYIG